MNILIAAGVYAAVARATEIVDAPKAQLHITWQDDFTPKEQVRIRQWLAYSAHSASLIGGFFPLRDATLSIHRLTKGKGPVPWAHTVRRQHNEGVVFHVNPRKSLKTFKRDWTATHEFSHLYLPYVGRDDAWISEGFASYYQYILMMRNGTLSQKQGWQALTNGLRRGERDKNQSGTLKAVSQKMRMERAFKRVYWTGALYFMELDLALRKQGTSLDQTIINFQNCCKNKTIDWNGLRLAEQLDIASNTRLFSEKYLAYEQIEGFPRYDKLLLSLGIDAKQDKIRLSSNEAVDKLRDAISAVRAPTDPAAL